jgi:enoyl-CoA hydratase/carnithine racemase
MMAIENHVVIETRGCAGLITLNRPKALNALSLGMIRQISAALLDWQAQPAIQLVAIRGMGKNPAHAGDSAAPAFVPFGTFCAGGDIRYFHQAVLAGDPSLEDFFTEEYALNHLIHTYPKPYVAFMDGIVFGGGMGISQGASHRIVTERTKMAMPETGIGLFPDVGGGYFLSRCPGRVGEYLALTGILIDGDQALAYQLADAVVDSSALEALWSELPLLADTSKASINQLIATKKVAARANIHWAKGQNGMQIDAIFAENTVSGIMAALAQDGSAWALETIAILRQRSPLMLHVVLELIRRARSMTLADDLRLERGLVRHCFAPQHLGRTGVTGETQEGIRALAVDKDHKPQWNPAQVEDVTPEMVQPFFISPWPSNMHPLRSLI